jgi:hypothetical protein
MKKQKRKQPKTPQPPEMPGLDYGLENALAIMTAPDFNDNFRAANIIACAYGMKHSDELIASVPIISVVATKPELLMKSFLQFTAWTDTTGPDAFRVEILYSGEPYYTSFGPDAKHLLWRTIGLDQTVDPLIFGLTYIKTIDTRNPFLDRLAERALLPIAPTIVAGAGYSGPEKPSRTLSPSNIQPIPGCPEIFLFQLPVYKTPADVPKESGLDPSAVLSGILPAGQATLARGDLERVLDDAIQRHRITWIIGPAGSGKTVLLAQWAIKHRSFGPWVLPFRQAVSCQRTRLPLKAQSSLYAQYGMRMRVGLSLSMTLLIRLN